MFVPRPTWRSCGCDRRTPTSVPGTAGTCIFKAGLSKTRDGKGAVPKVGMYHGTPIFRCTNTHTHDYWFAGPSTLTRTVSPIACFCGIVHSSWVMASNKVAMSKGRTSQNLSWSAGRGAINMGKDFVEDRSTRNGQPIQLHLGTRTNKTAACARVQQISAKRGKTTRE